MKVIQALDDADAVFGEDVELDSLDEQIPEELETDELETIDEAETDDSFDVADDELTDEIPEEEDELEDDLTADEDDSVADDEELVDGEDEIDEDEIGEDPVELPDDQDDDAILSDDEEINDEGDEDGEDDLAFLDEEETTTASEVAPGIEDEIGDEVHGGDPSTSEVAPGGDEVETSTDAEVFPTESEYVSSIVKRLDRVANYLEKKGQKRMAYRIDMLSDKLEASLNK